MTPSDQGKILNATKAEKSVPQRVPAHFVPGRVWIHTNQQIEFIWKFGVPNRVRTCDLLIKSQLLYQLSYGHEGLAGTNRSGHLGRESGPVNRSLHAEA